MIDMTILTDALYATASPFAADAVLTLAVSDAEAMTLPAYDGTRGKAAGEKAEIETVGPYATVRAADLDGIDMADLRGATLVLNGVEWIVTNHEMRQGAAGEAAGEIALYLEKA